MDDNYVFDGAVRYLTGVSPQSKVHQLWEELGVLEGQRIHFYDQFECFQGSDGRSFCMYTDIDRLEQHMLDLAPEDRGVIHEFAEALRQFTKMEVPVDITPSDLLEMFELGQSMLPVLLPVLRWRTGLR
jgi:hypothetical protein